ncbi:acyl-CoA synthetase FdrA [Rahnella sp. SL6]|uniref:acyl-CoA synthetase FdrA n=1 Tax=Rahnella perminowiae TaxID=2816244 RepID=UPI001C261A4A|nr:acyl-CoA synthetase FdrA [Rahnella perminowiae]MBU9811446.1 acyl-CoA synthetase FdrA [Rahnella perminowiae]
MIHACIRKGSFQDSVSLMIISRELSQSPDVDDVSVMMGTPANKSLLEATGFWHACFEQATPNDICVAVRSQSCDASIIAAITAQLDEALKAVSAGQGSGRSLPVARRFASAEQRLPEANLMLISIAGEYAAGLAHQALDSGRNVMIFSDNVTLEDEIALKQKARDKGLLVMGPDCGTAIIAGAPLAFANVLPRGVVGVVGASGTGIQELTSQIALNGQGISQAIGLGGRDLSAQVGGISALTSLQMLADDPQSQVLAFVSKPPAEAVRLKVMSAMKAMSKPVVALFLGVPVSQACEGNVWLASTLDEAARIACLLARVVQIAESQPAVAGKKIAGLFTGGTLAAEAAMVLAGLLGIHPDHGHLHGTMLAHDGHRIIDLGDDFYTVGKPHPMIDPTSREQLILGLAGKPETGVLLLDVVIGYGAQRDPAGSVASAVRQLMAQRIRHAPVVVVAVVTGSEQDPQCRSQQIATLREAGILVVQTLPEATVLAHHLCTCNVVTSPASTSPLLSQVSVINAGLRNFAQDLQSASVPVVHYPWSPVAGGNRRLASLVEQLG